NEETRIRAVQEKTRQRARGGRPGRHGRGSPYIFSGLLRCAECGASYVIVSARDYGCATHKDRGPAACSNNHRVRREHLEERLLTVIRDDLLTEESFETFMDMAREAMEESQPDPAAIRKRLQEAERERDNLVQAIRQGIASPAVKEELEQAERTVKAAQEELTAAESLAGDGVATLLPRARERFKALADSLRESVDPDVMRQTLSEVTGPIDLEPDPQVGVIRAKINAGSIMETCVNYVGSGGRI
ncbi:MAG: recombinase zinc beta ribbon domain-containing protein, partial [Pseudomonadota bacterium]